MKKFLSLLAAFTFVFGVSVNALATVPNEYTDWDPIEIDKALTVVNDGTINPAETFYFVIGDGSGIRDGVPIDAPLFTDNTFEIEVGVVAEGESVVSGTADINLPTFDQVGIYTYKITETEGDTAGMVYDSGIYLLIVTVINNPDYTVGGSAPKFLRVLSIIDEDDPNVKDDAFDNEFYAGDLTVTKELEGNFTDPDDEFTITVTVTPIGEKVINPVPIVWDTDDVEVVGGVYTATYTLKGGESITIENLPYDVSYVVLETAVPHTDYMVDYDDNADRNMNLPLIETTITNTRNTTVNTGISLDSLPYILILGFAASGMGLLFFRRRHAF